MSDETTAEVVRAADVLCDANDDVAKAYEVLKDSTGFDVGTAGHRFITAYERRETAVEELKTAVHEHRKVRDAERRKRHYVVGRYLGDIDGYVAGQVRGGRRNAVPIKTSEDPSSSAWRGYRPVDGDELVVLAGAINGQWYAPCIRMLQIMDRDGIFSEQLTLLAAQLPGDQ